MSKRNSFSEKIGKYLGFFPAAYSLPNEEKRENDKDNNNNKNINNNINKMAHPGLSMSNNQNYHHNKQNNYNYKNNNDVFDTKNFDKIDYIVQIPLIDNPNERQTRFLLAMDYTLPARDGLGIMDTALEHIVHYYDMNKVELIFCEMWQSVCLFIEFHDTTSCTNAYNQLFQFFKTIFYVENLSQLEELWICGHCKHYNQFDEYLRGLNSINDKRKTKKGDEYIYWCNRCKNVNHPSFKKIKYSYQSLPKPNKKRKSNRDQIGSVSFPCSKPKWVDAKSQPIANRALTLGAPQNHNANINNDADVLRTVGCDILMGQARGSLKFNLPNNMKSKSMDCLQQQHNRNISGISSSPELISPTSSAGAGGSGIGMSSLYNHGKKSSLDSALSVTSTTSTVSSIDNNLDLCCSILQTIQQETETLSSHSGNTHPQNTSITHQNLQQLQQQRNDVVQKIATLNNMLTNIQNTFTNAIENHKYCMHQSVQLFNNNKNNNECKIDNNNNGNVYKSHNNNNNKPTRGGPILTSQNLYDYNQQNQLLSDEDTSHSDPYNYNNYNYNQYKDDDELRTPAGTDILMGQARGPIAFKLPAAHHSNSNHHKQ